MPHVKYLICRNEISVISDKLPMDDQVVRNKSELKKPRSENSPFLMNSCTEQAKDEFLVSS